MNKSENVGHRKSVLDSEIDNRGRDNVRKNGIRRSGPLRIFLESEKHEPEEVKLEKKSNRDFHGTSYLKGKRKPRSVKVDYFEELKSQLVAEKLNRKLGSQFLSNKGNDVTYGKSGIIEACEMQQRHHHYHHQQQPQQQQQQHAKTLHFPKSFIEAIATEKAGKSFNCPSNLGTKETTCLNSGELKLTKSDYRKIHINEILKSHAQKVQSSKTCIQVKSSTQGIVSELLTRGKIFQHVEEKKGTVKNEVEIKKVPADNNQEREKEKSRDREKDGGKEKEADREKDRDRRGKEKDSDKEKDGDREREKDESVRKAAKSKWIGYPQSKELESRLEGTWKNSLFFRDSHEEGKGTEIAEDDKKAMQQDEDERKGEKRTTYTDRLLLLRTVGKKKDEGDSDHDEQKKAIGPTNIMSLKLDISQEIDKAVATSAFKSVAQMTDAILKPKATRSSELRDLVSQAVKEHKIFCIFDNHWYIVRPVREELLNRGWLEVIPDRRLIPRRRPPPTGPLMDRDKFFSERNSNAIEAILTAKEVFASELEETVTKSFTFLLPAEKTKISLTVSNPSKKQSDLSLRESNSLFRITPPTGEKKRNNSEIREFVSKCNADKFKDSQDADRAGKTAKEKEKIFMKALKKQKESAGVAAKNQKGKTDEKQVAANDSSQMSPSLQIILDTISDDKKTILQALTEVKKSKPNDGEPETVNDSSLAKEKSTPEVHQSKKEKDSQAEDAKISFKENDAKTISKIIQSTNAKIHFMWLSIKPAIHLKCFNYSPEIINKFQRTTFCTKIGLWNHLNNIQWYAHEVHFPAKSPRMYNTGEAEDLQAFFQDFQLTACISMLKWLADTFFDRGIKAVQTKKGKVPLRAFEFAIKQCERYMRFKDNEDLSILDEPKVLQEEWNTFLQWFYTITNDHGKLQESSNSQLMVVYTKAVETLRTMKKYWPEIDIDGKLNIWIMKPYCASCGRGIFMTNNVYYIGQHSKYIVQKYIERPLLIYNTKFDIRQWFMITKLTPLEIWMYKECYLRFCTQPFALRNLHESVHLSNNSVQRKYINRYDPSLSDQNMWDSNTFQVYLNTIGHPNAWNEVIYPGMRDAIVSIMLAAQDNFDGPRRNWFEVYGADFMLSANVKDGPWLIEINENPAMDPSTKVTARLCPQMLRDVIKVVVDKKANKNACTGQWELVYRQNYSPSFATVDLDVKGRKIAKAPTSMKIEFSHVSGKEKFDENSFSAKAYEIVKSFRDNELAKTSEGSISKKDRNRGQVESAKEMIDKVIAQGGRSIKANRNPFEKSNTSVSLFARQKSTAVPSLPIDSNWRFDFDKTEKELNATDLDSHKENADSNDKIVRNEGELTKYKFTKF